MKVKKKQEDSSKPSYCGSKKTKSDLQKLVDKAEEACKLAKQVADLADESKEITEKRFMALDDAEDCMYGCAPGFNLDPFRSRKDCCYYKTKKLSLRPIKQHE
jgi:hypothetical protein